MVWPGVGISLTRSLRACCALDDVDAVGGHDRQHRIGDPGTGRRIVLLPLGPVLELAVGEDVARLGEGRHPAAVLEPRVPADVVDVQMRAHDEVDVADAEARRPPGPSRSGRTSSCSRTGASAAACGCRRRCRSGCCGAASAPGSSGCTARACRCRVDVPWAAARRGSPPAPPWSASGRTSALEERALLLDDAVNGDVAHFDGVGHGSVPLRAWLREREW